MTKRIGGTVFIEGEPDDTCAYCGKIDELRPYGKNGARICFDCGMKSENKTLTEQAFGNLLKGPHEA